MPPPTTSSSAVEERVDVGHPVLEQVADAARAVGEQFVGVGDLDVLGEHEHRRPRAPRRRASTAARSPSSVCVGGIRTSTTATSGRCSRTARTSEGPSADRGDDLGAGLLEQPDQALPEQHRVLGEDYPHGRSAVSRVGPPRGLSTVSSPSTACSRSASPARPCPGADTAPPVPSSSTRTRSRSPVQRDVDPAGRRVAVLGHVGQRLADDEVGGVLGDRRRAAPAGRSTARSTGTGERAATAASAAARPRSASTGGAMPRDRARSSSSVSRARPAASPSVARAAVRVALELPLGAGEVHVQPDQLLLRAVVDVALQPAQRDRLGGDGGVAALGEPAELGLRGRAGGEQHPAELGLQQGDAADGERQRGRRRPARRRRRARTGWP